MLAGVVAVAAKRSVRIKASQCRGAGFASPGIAVCRDPSPLEAEGASSGASVARAAQKIS